MPRRGGEKMVLISMHLPQKMLQQIEELVRSDLYPNRSELIRSAIRELLLKHKTGATQKEKPKEGAEAEAKEEDLPLLRGGG
ncbi:putative transcriptional regulator [Pyrobaculum oguniense TE7]|uniref:Transcriptional regulator n=1 Tax=Pyrobaculum oguniense (strain DSM 13380 / JCM 10595 / TE7) TaxID=698757 RepID=H6Q830_PYROT|nr:putative transcriptional regulator [Pyrobaculum oguniense TE7]